MKLDREKLEYAAHATHFLIHITHEILKEAKTLISDEELEQMCKDINRLCLENNYKLKST